MKLLCRCVMLLLLGSLQRVALAAENSADESSSTTIVALVVPLLAVVFALAALWWMLRRYNTRGGAAGPLRIVQVLAVGPRERVLVVDHESRRFLLGVTSSTISLVADLGAEHAASERVRASTSLVDNVALTRD